MARKVELDGVSLDASDPRVRALLEELKSEAAPRERKGRKPAADRGLIAPTKGRPYWRIYFVDQHGHERKEISSKHKTVAREDLERRRAEVRAGTYVPPRQRKKQLSLFEDVLEAYEAEMKGRNRTAVRWDEYAETWVKEFRGRKVDEIGAADIEKWKLRQAAYKPATVNRKLSFLRRFFTLCLRDEVVRTSPFGKVKLLQENNTRDRFLQPDEEERLKAALPAVHWRVVLLAILTGLRQAEFFGLRRDQVDLETRFITIPRSKSGKMRRVKLSRNAAAILVELLKEHESPWVFPSQNSDKPLLANNFVRRVFRPALERAQIENFVWHDLRRTTGSRMVQRGVDLNRVREQLGHSNLRQTQRYAHLAPEHLEDAVDVLDRDR
jgi:site-specific recombinase XerD